MSANLAITFPGQTTGTMPASERLTPDNPIVGTSDALKYVMYRVDQVASTHTAVLLLGETGTGKELVARAIHQRSPRRNRHFVVVDCGALPGSLIESELFGRERAPSPARSPRRPDASSWPTAAPSSSTRSASCRWSCNPSCCGFSRKGRSSGSAVSTDAHRCPNRRGHQSEPPRRRPARTIPPGPLLSPQRLPHHHAGAARSP